MYGIDVGDDALLRARPWRWLQTRIVGLIGRPHAYDPAGRVMWNTRLQNALYPPPPIKQEPQTRRR